MSATADVIEAVRSLAAEPLAGDPLTVARQCLLDWLGCALAGAADPLTDMLAAEAGGPEEATLIGRGARASAPWAALVNGAASHALDYDDTHTAFMGHPTVPVMPAALALAERTGASGADFLRAYVAGVETECRIGLLAGGGHYETGWHATATLGTFGAAAAGAVLLDLDDDGWHRTFGLAATQAAGSKANFGTMAKPLHAGKAAMNGLLSATLAARGFTANTEILEVAQGFGALYNAGPRDIELPTHHLVVDTLFKFHAACYLTHAAIEATRRLGLSPSEVERVEVHVHPSTLKVCAIPEPRTGLEVKFSLRATTALALLGRDTSDPAVYSDATATDPDLIAMRDLIEVVPDGRGPSTAINVVAHRRGGDQVALTVDTGVPERDLPRQGDRLEAKFRSLAEPVIGKDQAESVLDLVNRAETMPSLAELCALTHDRSGVSGSSGRPVR